MQNQDLRRNFQGKPQSTKPKRHPFKTFLKWMAIGIGVPFALFVTLGIAGVWDGTPEQQARWEQERLAKQAQTTVPNIEEALARQKQEQAATVQNPARPSDNPALAVTQASVAVKQRGETDRFNIDPAPICETLKALDSYKALQHSGRWEAAMQMTSCITLPEQTDVIYVRSMRDYVRVIWTLKDGSTQEGWVSDYDFAMQSIHDLRACKTRECRQAVGVDG